MRRKCLVSKKKMAFGGLNCVLQRYWVIRNLFHRVGHKLSSYICRKCLRPSLRDDFYRTGLHIYHYFRIYPRFTQTCITVVGEKTRATGHFMRLHLYNCAIIVAINNRKLGSRLNRNIKMLN